MEGRLTGRDVAFDAPADVDDEDGWQAPQYFLEDSVADPAQSAEDDEWQSANQTRLHSALAGLDERSRDILARRWLSDQKSTLHELADEYGVSAERIRQLEQAAMKKMRSVMLA